MSPHSAKPRFNVRIIALLVDHDPPVLASTIGQCIAFADAAHGGRLVGETDDDRSTAREIASLYAEIKNLMRLAAALPNAPSRPVPATPIRGWGAMGPMQITPKTYAGLRVRPL